MIHRRDFLKGTALGAGAALLGGKCLAENGPINPKDMNVLFMASEDTPREGLSCYGNRAVKTPHLEAFAGTGVQFRRAYCPAPVCNPSRTSLATGVRTDKTDVWGNTHVLEERMPAKYVTMPEYFRDQGFYTCAIGKFFHHNYQANKQARAWHEIERSPLPEGYTGEVLGDKLYDPRKAPPNPKYPYKWDENPKYEAMIQKAYEEYLSARDKYPEGSKEYYASRKPFQIAQMYRVGDSMEIPERSADGIKARVAAERLRQFAKEKRRFFMSVQSQSPHTPFLCPKKYLDMYPIDAIRTTGEGVDKDVGVPEMARRNDQEEFGPRQFYGTERDALRAFYGCCSFMDEQFGIVLKALKETGLDRNTIVVYFGDHGFMTGQHGLWCKNVLFEEASAVPLIVRVPGASENGTRCDDIVELIDLFPTLHDYLELPGLPYELDGESLGPLLDKNRAGVSGYRRRRNQCAYTAINHGAMFGYAVRQGHYRYSEYIRGGKIVAIELYDLSKDPHEHHNLASDGGYREIAGKMAAELARGYPQRL